MINPRKNIFHIIYIYNTVNILVQFSVQQCQHLLRFYDHNHSSHLSCPVSQFIHVIENSMSTLNLFTLELSCIIILGLNANKYVLLKKNLHRILLAV